MMTTTETLIASNYLDSNPRKKKQVQNKLTTNHSLSKRTLNLERILVHRKDHLTSIKPTFIIHVMHFITDNQLEFDSSPTRAEHCIWWINRTWYKSLPGIKIVPDSDDYSARHLNIWLKQCTCYTHSYFCCCTDVYLAKVYSSCFYFVFQLCPINQHRLTVSPDNPNLTAFEWA